MERNYSNISEIEHELLIDLNNYYPDWGRLSIQDLIERRTNYAKLASSPTRSSISTRLAYYEVTEYIKIRCKLEGVEYGL